MVITLITGVLIGTVLGSYLVLVNNRNQGAMRAMAWNAAIPALEAGIEEALTHLNEDRTTPGNNNWIPATFDGQTVYWKTRTLPDGSSFSVTNFNVTSNMPSVISAGRILSPLSDKEYITRTVRVTLTNPPSPFLLAIAAQHEIRLSGNAVVDGYDSRWPYDTATNRNAEGNIGTNSTNSPAIYVGSGHIYGTAITGAGGTVEVSGGGSIGDINWNDPGAEKGWTDDKMYVYFQPNLPPDGSAFGVTSTSSGSTNVTYLTAGNLYKTASFISTPATGPIIVQGKGNATLWVTDQFIINGDYYVYIDKEASLTLYVGSNGSNPAKASISGLGVINASGNPNQFSYIGLQNNSALSYSGQSDFVGTVNAPQTSFNLSGNSSVFGGIICNTFTSSGSGQVHYDRALKGKALMTVNSWRELPAN